MTKDRQRKRTARDLAADAGLSYTAALRSLDAQQMPGPGGDRPALPVPAGLVEARHAGLCGYCGRKISPGTRIAAHREHWGHARCVGLIRPDVRSWLEEQARSHPTVEIPLLIATGYQAAGDGQSARRYQAEAKAAIRTLVDPRPPVPPQPAGEQWDDYEPEEPLLARASGLLREAASGAVPGTALTEAAGRCLQQLDLGYAADMIRGMRIAEAPDGPATAESVSARRALDILGEASRVGRRGDEEWTHCQELITWAGKIALGRLKPTVTMPDEVWASHSSGGRTSCWLEI